MTTPQVPSAESSPASRRDPGPVDIAARLKQETAREHAAIEAVSGILHQGLTREEYERYLERWFGFLAPLEAELCQREVWSVLGLSAVERAKRVALERDLEELGATLSALPVCAPPDLPGLPEAVGSAYVLEGSTLGGRVLSRHVQLCLGDGAPRRFLDIYGPDIGSRWQAFRGALADYAGARDTQDRVIAGAKTTFVAFTRWLERP